MSLRKKIISGTKWTTLSSVLLILFSILRISVLARFLDKQAFGIVAIATFVLSLFELFNTMGLNAAIFHKKDINRYEYASLYWLNLLFSLLLYSILLAISPLIASFYNDPIYNSLIPVLGLNFIFSAFGRQFRLIFQKRFNFKLISVVETISAGFSFILAVLLAYYSWGVWALIYSTLFQFFLSNCIFFIKGLKGHGLLFYCNVSLAKPFLKIGSYQLAGQFINAFTKDLDILIIGKLFGKEILGGYSLARQLVRRPIGLLNPIINTVGTPSLAHFNDDRDALKKYYLQLVNIVSSVTIPMYLLVISFAPMIVSVLYGPAYLEIVTITQILAVNMVFRNIGGTVGNLVFATGRTDLDFKWNLFTMPVIPVFVYIGSLFNIEIVAMLVCLSSIILYYPSWRFYIRKIVDVSFFEYFLASFRISYNFLKK